MGDTPVEQHLATLIIDGQRQEVWVRCTPGAGGEWTNALVFRRDGKLSPPDAVIAEVDWRLPPEPALQRALEIEEMEQVKLFRQARGTRPPLF